MLWNGMGMLLSLCQFLLTSIYRGGQIWSGGENNRLSGVTTFLVLLKIYLT